MTSPGNLGNSPSQSECGFALIVVLWVIGLISLLTFSVVWTTRLKIQTVSNIVDNTKAEGLADATVALVKLAMLPTPRGGTQSANGAPRNEAAILCSISNGALVAVAVENETGKVDLNAATPEILTKLLRGIGASNQEAEEISGAIGQFARIRIDSIDEQLLEDGGAGAVPPKHAPFESILELDQVRGMKRDLFEAMLPYVTIYSHRPDVDPAFASTALMTMLSDAPTLRGPYIASEGATSKPAPGTIWPRLETGPGMVGGSYLIHAETLMRDGGYFVREANIDIVGGANPIRTAEWRRGRSRYRDVLSAAMHATSRGGETMRLYPECAGQSL